MSDQQQVDLAALDRLADLYKDGLITREEFERGKAALFPTVSQAPGPQPAPPVQEAPKPPVPAPEPPKPEPKVEEKPAEPRAPGFQLPSASAPPAKAAPIAPPPSSAEIVPPAPRLRKIDVSSPPPQEPEVRIPVGPNKRPAAPQSARPSSKGSLFTGIAIVAIVGFVFLIVYLMRDVSEAGKPVKSEEEWKPSPSASTSPKIDLNAFKMEPGNPIFDVEFDQKIKRLESVHQEFSKKLDSLHFDEVLTAKQLATKAGRAKSRNSVDLAWKYSNDYWDGYLSAGTQLATWYSTQTGKTLVDPNEMKSVVTEQRQEYQKLFDLYRKAIGYVESYRPVLGGKSKILLFNTSRQVKNYNSNLAAIDKQMAKILKAEESFKKRLKPPSSL